MEDPLINRKLLDEVIHEARREESVSLVCFSLLLRPGFGCEPTVGPKCSWQGSSFSVSTFDRYLGLGWAKTPAQEESLRI